MSDPSARIISHMNKDHKLALIDYVVVFGNQDLGTFDKSSVRVTEVTDKYIALEYITTPGRARKILTLDWNSVSDNSKDEVHSLKDVKRKLITMAKYAARRQGYSPHQITKVLPPTIQSAPLYFIGPSLAVCAYDLELYKSFFRSDKTFQYISQYFPKFLWSTLDFTGRHAPAIFGILAAVHLVEILVFSVPKTREHRVPTPQRLAWIAMHWFEGFYVIKRIRSLIPKDE